MPPTPSDLGSQVLPNNSMRADASLGILTSHTNPAVGVPSSAISKILFSRTIISPFSIDRAAPHTTLGRMTVTLAQIRNGRSLSKLPRSGPPFSSGNPPEWKGRVYLALPIPNAEVTIVSPSHPPTILTNPTVLEIVVSDNLHTVVPN